jgi:hypothetical protein
MDKHQEAVNIIAHIMELERKIKILELENVQLKQEIEDHHYYQDMNHD